MIEFSDEIRRSEEEYAAWSRKERQRLEGDRQALLEAVKSPRFFWLTPEDRAALVERAGEHPPGVYTVLAQGGRRRPEPLVTNVPASSVPRRRRSKFQRAFRASLVGAAQAFGAGLGLGFAIRFLEELL